MSSRSNHRAEAPPSKIAGRIPATDALKAGEVYVWRLPLTADEDEFGRLRDVLSEPELARIERWPEEGARRRRIVCWGRVRRILAELLGCAAGSVPLIRDARGRPLLDRRSADLCLSLSHSGGWALLAISIGARVGIDIERVRPIGDAGRLSERFLSPAEAKRVLNREDVPAAFFRAWTRKEALIKGLGLGVPGGLGLVSVVETDGGDLIVEPPHEGWTVVDVDPPEGYAASIAVESPVPMLRLFEVGLDTTAARRHWRGCAG